MTQSGPALRLRFNHANGLLLKRAGGLSGFSIAGADGKWVWAEAHVEGDTVVVSAPDVPVPVAARYAWADNPPVTLYNAVGLPASPFRTDEESVWKKIP